MTKMLFHKTLPSGVELAVDPMPDRRIVSFEFRLLTGTAYEPAELLGLARLTEEVMDKGTARKTGRQLSDAFDAIGAQRNSWTGREGTGFTLTLLPEHLEAGLDLIAEWIREPAFPEDACRVAVDLARQEIDALEDDPGDLADRMLTAKTYGSRLGRHPLGTRETLERIGPDEIRAHWASQFAAARMQVSAAGAVDPDRLAALLDARFAGFGPAAPDGRDRFDVEFAPGRLHEHKDLEQVQIGISFPGVPLTHDDFPAQRVIIAILSDGMSSRLFSEVREKQGLAYSVSAWDEYPRGSGMLFMHASTKPERCNRTYETLLREIDRLADDVTEAERARAIKGIVARTETRGDLTRAHTAELAADLFHYGAPRPLEEKLNAIRAVTRADITRYLESHKRDALAVVTLGPRDLEGE